jgi:hypothetical protein
LEIRAAQFDKNMLGRMEVYLLSNDSDDVTREGTDSGDWRSANCPSLSEGYCANKQRFAAEILGITSTAEAVIELKKLQWI